MALRPRADRGAGAQVPSAPQLAAPRDQLGEDSADDRRDVDQGDHAHGALALGAFEQIDLVDFDQT